MPDTALPARITGIYRYPVKGLTPEQLSRTELSPGQTLLADRRYAIENGPSGFDPAEPKWLPKPHFLMLMRDEWLAGLRTQFDDSSNVLSINHNGRIVAQGNLATPEGRRTIETFFASTFPDLIKGPPKVLESPGHSFSDVARKVVSIINLASVRAIEGMVGAPVHPLRFRANLYVEGWPAWHEFDLLDRTLSIGDVRTQGREAHRSLRRRQCRSGYGPARPCHPDGAAAPARPRRLRDLCRGDRGRSFCTAGQNMKPAGQAYVRPAPTGTDTEQRDLRRYRKGHC